MKSQGILLGYELFAKGPHRGNPSYSNLLQGQTVRRSRSAREALHSGAISLETLRALRELRDSRSVLDLTLTVGSVVAVPVFYAMFPHPLTFVACMLLTVRNFNCAAQLVHESDHATLFRHPWLNTLMGNLCAYILGYTRSGHRQAHMDHHIYLNTERDPDIIFSQPDKSGQALLIGLAQDLFLISAIKRFLQYFQSDRKTYSVSPWRNLSLQYFKQMTKALCPVVLTQAAIVLLFAATTGPIFYVWLYVLPIMTLYPLQIRVRSIAEYSFDHSYHPQAAEDAWVARTSHLNLLERFIMAPLSQYYHYEHHVFPNIPNYNLAKVHRLLVNAGIPVPTNDSYVGFVFRKIRTDLRGVWKTK